MTTTSAKSSYIDGYLHLIENTLEGKMVHHDGVVIEADKSFCKILGYSPQELIGSNSIELIAEDYRQEAISILEEDKGGCHVLWMKRKNGETFPAEIECKSFIEDGKDFHIVCIIDISVKKDAEDKLLASEMRFRTVTEHSSDITFIMDTDGRCKYISPSIRQSIGFSNKDLIGLVANHIFHPKDLNKVIDCKKRAISKPGTIIKLDSCRVKHKQLGTWVYFEGLFNYLPKAPGVEGVVVNCRVITNRLKKEQQLRESWERLGMTIDAVSDGYWDWNIKTGEVFFSDKWINNLGYSRQDVEPNQSFWDKVIHPDDIEKDAQELERHFAGGKEFYECEYRILNKDGEYSWNLNRGKVVAWDEQNNPLRMAGTSVDVTEKKEAELEKKRLQNQLQQAQKLETIGTLASGIAHDFKNLLNPIIGFSKLALEDIHDPEKLKCDLEIIKKASERANDLVNQIFTFSKKTNIVKEPVKLSDLIEEVVDLLDVDLSKGITIEKDISIDGDVLVDNVQLHQVIMNLLKNALQAMESKGNLLEVKLYQKLEKGTELVVLEVKDNGPGMDVATQTKIFDPFFTTKQTSSGTGLGLAVVHGIITSHNGTIEVDSAKDIGTTFTIKLPKHVQEAGKDVKARPIAVLVDDEEMSLLLLKRVLTNNGFECVTFDNGLDALKYITNNKDIITLVISDEALPGISGTELCKIIKTLKNSDLHTVLTTNNPHLHLSKMKEKGVNSLYIKPLNIYDITEKVKLLTKNIELT